MQPYKEACFIFFCKVAFDFTMFTEILTGTNADIY